MTTSLPAVSSWWSASSRTKAAKTALRERPLGVIRNSISWPARTLSIGGQTISASPSPPSSTNVAPAPRAKSTQKSCTAAAPLRTWRRALLPSKSFL